MKPGYLSEQGPTSFVMLCEKTWNNLLASLVSRQSVRIHEAFVKELLREPAWVLSGFLEH